MSDLEQHVAALEVADPQQLVLLCDRLAALVQRARPAVEGALSDIAQESASQAPRVIVPAPAILRPRAEMKAAEKIEMGLGNYASPCKAAAFFDWVNPDGTARKGDADLASVNVDSLIQAFGGSEKLTAALQCMEQEPGLTLGPDYGDPQLNFIAMILAMNRTKGRTPQKNDAYVNPVFGSVDPEALEGKPILGYRPAMIDGMRNPLPYSHDNSGLPWAKRLAARQRFLAGRTIIGTDRLSYADLAGLSLAGQEPADSVGLSPWTYTVFDADNALSSSLVPRGVFDVACGRPDFDVSVPEDVLRDARFRSVLRGNVLR
ncbi:hypothetical protein HZA43_00490 [Candidatus Peregrinibacteria bacterium]|nr:hypothetical protein [Candidatus Peregrinibacteria bacterium]